MPEMSYACDHHGQIVGQAIINAVFVSYRSTGLDECCNACFMSHLYAIIKWKEGIACHYRTFQVKIKLPCFFYGLPECINPACLSAAFSNKLFILYQRNCI